MVWWETCDDIERDPEKLGGAWIFRDTRVPVSALFANLRDGATVAEFLEWFPGVEPWQVQSVLECTLKDLESSKHKSPRKPPFHPAPTRQSPEE